MNVRIALTISALALLLPLGTLRAADADKEAIKAFEAQMKEADDNGKVALIENLAKSGNPGAGKAIGKHIGERSTAVKVAAIKAVGQLEEKSWFGRFMGMLKPAEKGEPKVLAALLEAVGRYGNKASLKEVVKLAKKWLFKDSEVASAAALCIGNIPMKDSVKELIKLLDLTYPKQSADGPTVSQETRALLAKSRPAVMQALRNLTGWDFGSARAWSNFWKAEQRSWKPGKTEFDLTKIKKWRDPGYLFEITQPHETWVLSRPTLDDPKSSTRIMMTKSNEDVTQGRIYVIAYDMSNFTSMTAEGKRQEYEDNAASTWKDIKADRWERGEFRVGREKGCYHLFVGMDTYGSTAIQKNVFIVRDGMMYIIGAWCRSGQPQEIYDARDKAFDSFKFIDVK